MIFFLPIPIYINITLQGKSFPFEDADTDDIVNISIKGWHLNYLFRSDKIKGTLTITPYDFEESNSAVYEFTGEIFAPSSDIDIKWSTLIRYSAIKNSYTGGTVFFNKNFEKVMVTESGNKGCFYVAPVKTNDELDEIFNYFKDYIHIDTLSE